MRNNIISLTISAIIVSSILYGYSSQSEKPEQNSDASKSLESSLQNNEQKLLNNKTHI